MTRLTPARIGLLLAALPAALIVAAWSPPAEPPAPSALPGKPGNMDEKEKWTTAVEPKPLSEAARRGLTWLVEHQLPDGGWNQGEESRHVGGNARQAGARSNVGDTAAALMALMRSGSSPSSGPYAESIRRGVDYLLGKVEASGSSDLSVTDVNGTRLQAKLGRHIDTFLASMVLSEAAGRMPDKETADRVGAALDKVLNKIQVNQGEDGRWGGSGWAPALANSLAVKGLNRAAQLGFVVSGEVLAKAATKAQGDVTGGQTFDAREAAGVALYAGADRLSTLTDTGNTYAGRKVELERRASEAPTAADRDAARRELAFIRANETALEQAQQAVIARLDDAQFIAGFGSNGGEEFLSYMNIGESLVIKGGDAWRDWDREMTANVERIQNGDGSWTGHHCITGRTFCTASALMVLLTDRTPVPVTGDDSGSLRE